MNAPVAHYCLLMRCVQVQHTSHSHHIIQFPVMLISPFSGRDDERGIECDFSGARLIEVRLTCGVLERGSSHGMTRQMQASYAYKAAGSGRR